MPYVILTFRLVVGGVLLVAACRKLWGSSSWSAFTKSVRELSGVPPAVAPILAAAAIAAELVIGGALVAGIALLIFPFAAAALLAFYTAVLGRALRRPRPIPCLCLGEQDEVVAWRHVGRNLVLIGLAIAVALGESAAAAQSRTLAGAAICALVSAVIVFMIVILDDLAALLHKRTV